MAVTIVLVLFATMVFHESFTLPISHALKSVQDESGRTLVFDLQTVLSRDDKVELGRGSVPIKTRTKREAIVNHSCADGMVWFKYRCVTLTQYKLLTGDDDE